jgi:hypothetical protein
VNDKQTCDIKYTKYLEKIFSWKNFLMKDFHSRFDEALAVDPNPGGLCLDQV